MGEAETPLEGRRVGRQLNERLWIGEWGGGGGGLDGQRERGGTGVSRDASNEGFFNFNQLNNS